MEKIFKKSLALMVSAALCLTAFVGCLTVNAEGTATPAYTITAQDGKAGDTVEVKVDGTNLTSVCGQQLFINIPSGLTITSVKDNAGHPYVSAAEVAEGNAFDYNVVTTETTKQVRFVDIINFPAAGELGAIETAEFHVVLGLTIPQDAVAGDTYTIGSDDLTMFANYGEEQIAITVEPATITVQAAQPACEHANATYDYSVVDGNCVTKKVCPDCGNEEVIATIPNVDKLGHAPVLASGLSINFRIPTDNVNAYTTDTANYSDVYAVFNKEGFYESTLGGIDSTTDTVYGQVNGTNLQFSFTGISAKQMNNKIDTQIFGVLDGHVVLIASEEDYSLVTYIKTMYNSSAVLNATAGTKNAAFRTLLVDLANYGAQAQTYLSYNTDNLANADIPQTYASETPTTYSNELETSGINIRRAPELGNKVLVNIRVNQSDVSSYGENFKFVVSYKDTTGASFTDTVEFSDLIQNGTAWQFTFDKISAATMAVPFTVTLLDGSDNQIGMLKYSVESYAQTVSDGAGQYPAYAKVLPLTQALVAYGRAADAYFNFTA